MPALLAGFLVVMIFGCGEPSPSAPPVAPSPSPSPAAAARAVPWQRTEEREPCAAFNPLRTPYFGDLHVHTSFSMDAYIAGTRGGAREAYQFARGETLAVTDDDEAQTRQARIERPLDFTAVTDHSEFFGEVNLCTTPGSLVYDDSMCQKLRQVEAPANRFLVTVAWLFPLGIPNPPASHQFCFQPGVDCDAAAVSVWQEMQAAAEAAYDRSAACMFTTFLGYEHTASPLGRHRHRNVIFRNHHVPPFAAGQLETYQGGIPQGVWSRVEADCLNAGTGCDAVIIPHNPNLSGGEQWFDPVDSAEAQRRQDREPLVEIHQQKGNSECRFDRLAWRGVQSTDELCTFEQELIAHEGPGEPPPSIDAYPPRNLVRNTLKDGLALEESLGVNPFQLGFAGGTDTHNATAGNTKEEGWEGGQGNNDSSPQRQIADEFRANPGGLTVAWAEENSRDALFDALRRRETYATSGTRPIVRFFAGSLPGVACGAADFVERAYRSGTPMGGELGAVRGNASPRFAVLAFKDAGTTTRPGTDLQRIQVVKGWLDAAGATREKVFDVAGNPLNGAGVDPATCAPVGTGARELCTVWEDPEFDRSQRAFYYVRALENPACRWSTLVCKGVGVDPFSPNCAEQAAQAGALFANCCLTQANDRFVDPVMQERAWTSPVWYRPEAIARVDGGVEFGAARGTDILDLTIHIGRVPIEFNLDASDLTVQVTDDDEIYRVTIPAGSMQPQERAELLVLRDGSTPADGLRSATFEIRPDNEGILRLRTREGDLSHAERTEHMVRVALQIGMYKSSYTRRWAATGNRLAPVSQ